MENFEQAFASAELLARQATEAARGRPVRMQANGVVSAGARADHCFDPWCIGRCEPRAHRRASEALAREGFEVWYPTGRALSRMPMRLIGPKKRRRKVTVLREELCFPYGDYIFMRRLFGCFEMMRIYELSGVIGLCMVGDTPASIHDFVVESLRLSEFDGEFDAPVPAGLSAKQLRLAEVHRSPAVLERWNDNRRVNNVLDGSGRSLVFVEEFGRITRIIADRGDFARPGPS